MNKTLGYSVCLVLPALDNLYDSNSYREGNVFFTPASPSKQDLILCVSVYWRRRVVSNRWAHLLNAEDDNGFMNF